MIRMIVLAAKSYAKSALSSQLSSAVSRCGCDDLARLFIRNSLKRRQIAFPNRDMALTFSPELRLLPMRAAEKSCAMHVIERRLTCKRRMHQPERDANSS
jgi:hypothetical protein